MTPKQIYAGSNGEATKRLYEKLEALGAAGVIAMNLFRASKCSERAKVYRGRGYRREAYERKNYSLENLSRALAKHGAELGITWGWKEDPKQEFHNQVLYVEIPRHGQVSFHAATRFGSSQEYAGEWDEERGSCPTKIVNWTTELLGGEKSPDITLSIDENAITCKTPPLAIRHSNETIKIETYVQTSFPQIESPPQPAP